MTTLVDYEIRELCRNSGLVEPFDANRLNPTSIDVTLGSVILVEGRVCGPESERVRWQEMIIDQGVILAPGQFILAHTAETLRMPNWVEGRFQLKSSRAREGFNHLLADGIDPGFTGCLTLKLQNVNQRHSLEIKPGMAIGQLRFSSLDSRPIKSYAVTGRYSANAAACPSQG